MRMLSLLAAAAALASASALYEAKDDVLQLDEASFKKAMKESGLYLVEFYAPWCGHCKNLAPEWKKAAKALKGIVNVAAVDASGGSGQALGSKYGVQGFPTIKLFSDDRSKPIDYNGGRDAKSIVDWALSQANSVAKARLGGKAAGGGSKGGNKGSGKASGGERKASASEPGGGKHVVTLTESNFDELVVNGKETWFVEFYAPWCGHCKSLAPEWAQAAQDLSAEAGIKFGAVDATVHQSLGSRFNVRGFPTIKTFSGAAGSSSRTAGEDYNGPREAGALVAAAGKLLEAAGFPGEVKQLTSTEQWEESCGGKRVCILAFLPSLLDERNGAKGRQARLDTLAAAASKSRGKPIKFLWSEAGAQPALESGLGVSMYPSVVAVASEKRVSVAYKGAFKEAALASFAAGITSPRGAAPFPEGWNPAKAVVKAAEWDGKDAPAPAPEAPLDEEL